MSEDSLKFPDGFMWGTATAAFQIEGGASDRGDNIWDRYCKQEGKVLNGDTGQVACDHYNRFRSDITDLIKPLGTKCYRFSISWGRLLKFDTSGDSLSVSRNEKGVRFYNELIDALIENGITSFVTLYHWDLPVEIEDATGGWPAVTGSKGAALLVQQFETYARECFELFGDRVKWWITLNEPWCSTVVSYEIGEHAPGDTSEPGVKAYLAGHNLLLAHAAAVKGYRQDFQDDQKGMIGITLNSSWFEADRLDDENCVKAARRGLDFELGWFAHPVFVGDYPDVMRETLGDRLPSFTEEERASLRQSSDFFGLNHYSTIPVQGLLDENELKSMSQGYFRDRGIRHGVRKNWGKTDMGWYIAPHGLTFLLEYIQKTYGGSKGGIIITENGLAVREDSLEDASNKQDRVSFYRDYLKAVHDAIHGSYKADVRGYFLWSLMDNFEWAFGYSKRFGLHYVDYETLERYPKPAVKWYASVIANNAVPKQ